MLYAQRATVTDWTEGWSERCDKNFDRLMQEDTDASDNDTLLGRVIKHGMADGYAYYQITKVNKRTVQITSCHSIGDDWVLPAWGDQCNIPMALVERFIWPGQKKLFGSKKISRP